MGEWPSPETVNKKGKVHVIINYLDFCNDELVTVISDEDLLTLSRMLKLINVMVSILIQLILSK